MVTRNNSRPPRLAEWIVTQTTPPDVVDAVLGDLCEELTLQGREVGPAWYWRQAMISGTHFAPKALLRLIPGYCLPLWLLDRLWAFLLSSIPLKEEAIRHWPMLAINLALACLLAALSKLPSSLICLASLILLAGTPADLPFTYWSIFLVLPAAVTHCHRKERFV